MRAGLSEAWLLLPCAGRALGVRARPVQLLCVCATVRRALVVRFVRVCNRSNVQARPDIGRPVCVRVRHTSHVAPDWLSYSIYTVAGVS